jgi:hypothetical protein
MIPSSNPESNCSEKQEPSKTEITSGQIQVPPGSPASLLGGLRVYVAEQPDRFTYADAAGNFHFLDIFLAPGTPLIVSRDDNVLGQGVVGEPLILNLAEAPLQPDTNQLIAKADVEVLSRILGSPEGVRPFLVAAKELALIETAALALLTGTGDIDAPDEVLTALLSEEPAWEGKAPPRAYRSKTSGPGLDGANADQAPLLWLNSPGAPVVAAALLPELGPNGSDRAISAYLRRAEPLLRLIRLSRAFAAGFSPPEDLLGMADWARDVLAGPRSDVSLLELLKAGPLPPPSDPFGGPLFPPLPDRWRWLDPINAEWLNCALRARPPILEKPPKGPTGLFQLEPSAACLPANANDAIALRLTAPTGGFGAQADFPDWVLTVGPGQVVIQSWTDTEVTAEVIGLGAGCHAIGWAYAAGQLPFDPIGGACRQALRLPAWTNRQPPWQFLPTPGGASLSVLDPRIQGFTADGSPGPTLTADGCSGVRLAWSVVTGGCPGSEALVEISLLRDGAVLRSGLGLVGSEVVSERETYSYTLRVLARNSEGDACGAPIERNLTVSRRLRLTLVLPSQLVVGIAGQATVRSSCPAPASGLLVTLAERTLNANRLQLPASGAVIPAGEREVSFALSGLVCGTGTVTADAPEYPQAFADTCVLGVPVIRVPPQNSQPMPACQTNNLTLLVGCVGVGVTATLIDTAPGRRRVPVAVGRAGASGGSCVGDATLNLTLPAVGPGTYELEIADRGGPTIATTLRFVTVPSVRADVAAPLVAQYACPVTRAELRFTAGGGTDRVEVTVASSREQLIVNRPAGLEPCAVWSDTAVLPVSCPTDSLSMVAQSGPVGSSRDSAPVSVAVRVDSTRFVSAIRFRNQSNLLLRISISRLEPDGMGGVRRVQLGDTPLGQPNPAIPSEFLFPLTPCAEYSFTVRQTDPTGERVVREVPSGIFGGACGDALEVLI